MNDLLKQLRDIRGLDPVSWWPPAPGWWIVAGLILLLIAGVFLWLRHRKLRALSWQAEVKALFSALRTEQDMRKQATELSELLRRLAIERFGRGECAGLEGESWLIWLKTHDPKGFDWKEQGAILIKAPYAPPGALTAAEIDPLIEAAERWVR